jgi:ATP-dependent Clp protease ATP-binding subunit ClpC
MTHLKRQFRPEFLNRVDDIIVFHALAKEHLLKIMDIMIGEIQTRLMGLAIDLTVSKKVREHLASDTDLAMGARPLRRIIQKELEDQLSEGILDGRFNAGDRVSTVLKGGKIGFNVRTRKPPKVAARQT